MLLIKQKINLSAKRVASYSLPTEMSIRFLNAWKRREKLNLERTDLDSGEKIVCHSASAEFSLARERVQICMNFMGILESQNSGQNFNEDALF